MNESTGPAQGPTPQPAAPRTALLGGGLGKVLRVLVYSGLVASLVFVGYMAYSMAQEKEAARKNQDRLVANIGLTRTAEKRLASGYVDSQGDLLADCPADPQQQLKPDRLLLAYYEGDADGEERVNWQALQSALGQATGLPVDIQPYLNSAEEVTAVAAGKIQLIALHSADVPYLVNNAGFIPAAVLADETGTSGNHLVLATAASSSVKTLQDLRNARLTCTRPNSITGYRAAIVVLSQQAGLLPNVDYEVHFSLGQKRSITGLIDGEFTVAALSADKIQEMIADGEIEPSDIRALYESQVIPRLTFGHIHRLEPELAAKIVAALLAFENLPAAESSSAPPHRFVAIDYRRDFEFVRQMDNSFDPRFSQQLTGDGER